MKSLMATAVALVSMFASGALQAQTGGMMNGGSMSGGGWMGGYGGYWGADPAGRRGWPRRLGRPA